MRQTRAVCSKFEPKPVRPELVEGSSFSWCVARNFLKKKRSFDKLRMDGYMLGLIQNSSFLL